MSTAWFRPSLLRATAVAGALMIALSGCVVAPYGWGHGKSGYHSGGHHGGHHGGRGWRGRR